MKKATHSTKNALGSPPDENKRKLLLNLGGIIGSAGIFCMLGSLFRTWLPSKKTLASSASIQISVKSLKIGEQLSVQWHGRPVWIIRRAKATIQQLKAVNPKLRDPLSLVPQQPSYAQNAYRSINPEYLVVVGVCTHLGCVPRYSAPLKKDKPAGFTCPCHGSLFDLAGRVFKNMPAPINLEIPPYHFINDHTIEIG